MHCPEADRLTVRERTVVWDRDELSGEFTACPAENNFGSSLSERESGCGTHNRSLSREWSGELTVRERERLWGRTVWGAYFTRERAVVGANCLGSLLSESGCGGELSGKLTVRERAVVGTDGLGSLLSERERERAVVGANCLESLLSERETAVVGESCLGSLLSERERAVVGES